MGYDNDQDDIILGDLDDVDAPSEAESEAAATEEIDDSQLSPEDGMRRRSAERRERRDRKRAGGATRAERREDRERKRARRKELRDSSPDTGRGKRIAAVTVAGVLCVTLVAGGVYYYYYRGRNSGGGQAPMTGPDAAMDFGNITIVSASGTTSIGMSLETFDLNLSDVDLTIDEVYVSNRDEVEENQPILKIDEDSIETARVKLQQAAKSAEYAYQLNEVSAQEDVITAKDTYQQALIALEYAEQDYADTVSEAQAEIDSLQRQVDEQQEKVDEYQAAVNDSEYYAKKYKVPEIKAQLEEDQQLLEDIYNDDSNRVAEHLDYVYGGSYEAWLNDEEFTASSDDGGGGMPGGDMPGGDMPGGDGGSQDAQNSAENTDDAENGSGTESESGGDETDSAATDSTSGSDTATDSAEATSGADSAETTATDDAATSTQSSDAATQAVTDAEENAAALESTSESVENTAAYAVNKIRVQTLSADQEATTSAGNKAQGDQEVTTSTVVNNEIYYAEMPSGTSGSAPVATGSGSSTGAGSSVSSGSSSSAGSSSSGSSATITDQYTTSSIDTSKALSTSSLSKSDLVYFPWYSAYVALSEEVTEEHQEYEEAVTEAERDQSRASSLLSQAQNKLESLQLKLRTAQNNLITTTEEAQETLDTVKAEAAAAQETYNTSIRSIENSADTLKDAMDTADENLESFEEQIGDGYLYTSNAGTIMMVGVEEGDTLTYNAMIAAYTDPGTISVTAAVDQSNIASISVGDTVAVVFDEAGIYQGYVAAINPVTQSSSRTSVTYSVTVELQGDVSAVEENISATVYFGDAVPLVFQQAGDELHSPDETDGDASSTAVSGTGDSAAGTGGSGSSSDAGDTDDGSALESLIEQTDQDIADAEVSAEAGTTAAGSGTGNVSDADAVADAADGAAMATSADNTTGDTAVANGAAGDIMTANDASNSTVDHTAATYTAAGTDTTSEGQ